MNKLLRSVAIAATSVVCIAPLHAAEVPKNAVLVTATRTAQTADEALASVSIITREDIERLQARSVEDLLRGEPGLSVSNNGGRGKATSIFMRGTEADHLLVMVDGIKVGSATLGTTAFQDLPIEQIERIEIVRGPRSSLYGSEAIGGVIQIFTRKGGGELVPFARVGGGSRDSYEAAAGVSGGGERSWFNVSASADGTAGFNACDSNFTAGCFVDEPDRDGYRNRSGSARWGTRFGGSGEVDLHWLRANSDSEYDGSIFAGNEANGRQEVYGARVGFAPLAAWLATLHAGRSHDDNENFKDGVFVSRFDTRRDSVSFQNDLTLAPKQLLSLGYDHQQDHIDSSEDFPVTSRSSDGVFVQYQGGFDANDIHLSLRRDDNEQFGEKTTGSAAWGYEFTGGTRVMLSHGTAFKAPSFNELYFPFFGNPNLKPENSRSTEVGVSRKHDWGRWALNAYRTIVDDLIGFDASFSPVNIDAARILGVEAQLGWRALGWDVNTAVTWLDPENRSDGANNGKVLPRRAQQAARIDVDRRIGAVRVGAMVQAEGHRYDDLANTRRMDSYTTVDVRTEYEFAKRWLLQARIENLFDKEYETAMFFNQPGRGYYLTLRYQP
jgi:vitamin B12 transporter